MSVPVSIFIMDVSNSSGANGDELSQYLQGIVRRIQQWTEGIIITKAVHRAGDEILLVSEHFSSAYIIASFLRQIWAYSDHPPSFGLAAGFLDNPITGLSDLESWNHPLIKKARTCLDELKRHPHRTWLQLSIDGEFQELSLILNNQLRLHQSLIDAQTHIQRQVCSLFYVLRKQSEVAKRLGKTPATVSAQMKQGSCEQLLATDLMLGDHLTHREAVQITGGDQEAVRKATTTLDTINYRLRKSIQEHLTAEWAWPE